MIAKAKSIAHTSEAVDYALQDKKDCIILKHNYCSGMSGTEINQEFKMFQHYNDRCINNSISIVLSPELNEGRGLTPSKMAKISEKFMAEMGLSENQYIAIMHRDKEHRHIHIIANRIDFNGVAYKDKHIGYKASDRGDKVAKEMGLVRAQLIRDNNIKARKNEKLELKREVKSIHNTVLAGKESLTFSKYQEEMKTRGVTILPTINNQGKTQGFRMEYKGENLKASEVNRDISLKKMAKGHSGANDFQFDKQYLRKHDEFIIKAPQVVKKKEVQKRNNNDYSPGM